MSGNSWAGKHKKELLIAAAIAGTAGMAAPAVLGAGAAAGAGAAGAAGAEGLAGGLGAGAADEMLASSATAGLGGAPGSGMSIGMGNLLSQYGPGMEKGYNSLQALQKSGLLQQQPMQAPPDLHPRTQQVGPSAAAPAPVGNGAPGSISPILAEILKRKGLFDYG